MTEMIDRLADGQAKFDGRELSGMPRGERERYRERARIAISGMREASYEMRFSDRVGDLGIWPETARAVWVAMIDEALGVAAT